MIMVNLKMEIKSIILFQVSMKEFEKYINLHHPNIDYQKQIIDEMKKIAILSIQSVYDKIDS